MNQRPPVPGPRGSEEIGPALGRASLTCLNYWDFGWNVGRIFFPNPENWLCFIKIKHREKHFLLNQRIRNPGGQPMESVLSCAFTPSIPNKTGSLMASFIWMFPYSSCHGTEDSDSTQVGEGWGTSCQPEKVVGSKQRCIHVFYVHARKQMLNETSLSGGLNLSAEYENSLDTSLETIQSWDTNKSYRWTHHPNLPHDT